MYNNLYLNFTSETLPVEDKIEKVKKEKNVPPEARLGYIMLRVHAEE